MTEKELTSRRAWLGGDGDAPLFLPAMLYSRMDNPMDYSYKNRGKVRREKVRQRLKNQPENAIVVGQARSVLAPRRHRSGSGSFHARAAASS